MSTQKLDALEVMDWLTLAVMVGFYGWLVYLVASTFVPIAGAVLGVAGCYLLLAQIEERRQRRKFRMDANAREDGEFVKVPSSSSARDARSAPPPPATTSTTEDKVWKAG